MGLVVASNKQVEKSAIDLRTVLNSGHTLRIYRNDLDPGPATTLASFTEANFTGYAGESVAGDWTSPVLLAPGQYQFDSSLYTWTNTGVLSQELFGWYIDDGTDWRLAQRFTSSITLLPLQSINIQVSPIVWARSVL